MVIAASGKLGLQQQEELVISTDADNVEATGTRGDAIDDCGLLRSPSKRIGGRRIGDEAGELMGDSRHTAAIGLKCSQFESRHLPLTARSRRPNTINASNHAL